MKFSLKTLAAAVALAAAAGSASAAIDNGQTGNGELFFSAWDGATSYNYDMNLSIDAYQTAVNAAGKIDLAWGADFTSSYASWLTTANTSTLQWSVIATDQKYPTRILATVDSAVTLPAKNKASNGLITGAGNVGTYVNAVNSIIGASGNSAVTVITDPAAIPASYAGNLGPFVYNKFNFDTSGNFLNNSYSTGLVFERTDVTGSGAALAINTAYVDEGIAVRAWVDGNNTLHIAAVPEPSEYALLLAGLGLMGVVARRRSQKQA